MREDIILIGVSKMILSERQEILSAWIKQIKAHGGIYSQISNSELFDTCGEFLDSFAGLLESGNFLKFRLFIEKISQIRSSQGFRLSEVQHSSYYFYDIIKPMIERMERKKELPARILDKVHGLLIEMLFELSDSYSKRLNERIDHYINEIERANIQLKETSIKDGLTDCYNQRYFHEVVDAEISRAKRYNRPLSIIMLDIDHFKKFNDTYGHLCGDEVLKVIGNILNKSIRSCDTVFRYGGEEFCILLPETKKDRAVILAERIRKKIFDNSFGINSRVLKVTVSGGVNELDNESVDKNILVANADKALYLAKKKGRNQVILYSSK